jgi:hypothetical protein
MIQKSQHLILFVLCFLLSSFAMAADFSVVDNRTGQTFECGRGSGGGSDPQCVSKVSDYCIRNTSKGSNTCLDLAASACRGSNAQFPNCVIDSTDYCIRNTSKGANRCLEMGLDACKGNFAAQIQLFSDVKLHQQEK